ncbi:MAG: flagellar hook-associated protein FlgK [Burkholderiales bacterium]|nr:flagellar hook-associated protein FlgK [Burkholderiales bacterium]
MGSGIFGIGVSGLNAAQAGLVTTGHNIANANTPGYHRQAIVQSTPVPLFTGGGFFGQGVNVQNVLRSYSEFLEGQVIRSEARSSYLSTYGAQLAQIDGMLADPAAGLSPALQEFFGAVHDVAANPSSMPSRQALLSGGEALAARFQAMDARLGELFSGINIQIASTVTSINAYAQEIANLNGRIVVAQSNPAQAPNDLLDQRDRMVAELNRLVGTTVVAQGDGTINVFIGNGQNLVVGSQSFRLSTAPSVDDPTRLDVAYQVGASAVRITPENLGAGSLGGLLAFRSGPLEEARNTLGRIAMGLARTFNEQHRLGQDLTGALGGNFFVEPQPAVTARGTNTGDAVIGAALADASALTTSSYRLSYDGTDYRLTRLSDNSTTTYASLPQTVDGLTFTLASGTAAAGDSFLIEPTRYAARDFAVALGDAAKIAAAAPVSTAAALANTGSAAISAGEVNPPPPADANLQQPVTITFTGAGTFDVSGTGTGDPTGVAYLSGGSISYNGWTVKITGTPAAGDSFTIMPNSGGTADNRNAALLAGLQTRNTLAGGTASYQGAYSQLTGSVGSAMRQNQVSAAAQENLAVQARQNQQSLSGVNLDEEAANLIRYQQAYQASGKVIEIATRLFDTLLGITGR